MNERDHLINGGYPAPSKTGGTWFKVVVVAFLVLVLAVVIPILGLSAASFAKSNDISYTPPQNLVRSFKMAPGDTNYANARTVVSFCNGTSLCGGMGVVWSGGIWISSKKATQSKYTSLSESSFLYVFTTDGATLEAATVQVKAMTTEMDIRPTTLVTSNFGTLRAVHAVSSTKAVVFYSKTSTLLYTFIDISGGKIIPSQEHILTVQGPARTFSLTCPTSTSCAAYISASNGGCYLRTLSIDPATNTVKLGDEKNSISNALTCDSKVVPQGCSLSNNTFVIADYRYAFAYSIDDSNSFVPQGSANNDFYYSTDSPPSVSLTCTSSSTFVGIVSDSHGKSTFATGHLNSGNMDMVYASGFDHPVQQGTVSSCYMPYSEANPLWNATGLFTSFKGADGNSYLVRSEISAIGNQNPKYITHHSNSLKLTNGYNNYRGTFSLLCPNIYSQIVSIYENDDPQSTAAVGCNVLISSGGLKVAGVVDSNCRGGQTAQVVMKGVVSGFSNLQPGFKYYYNNWGEIVGDAYTANGAQPLGTAISSTELLLDDNVFAR